MINPLAELKERLTYSAVAGTALLEEDFRLKKCMEGFAPLAQKNPVFGKIYDGLTELFAAEPEQRGKLLLNLLGLVDAVLYTQAGYGAQGELVALQGNAQSVQQLSYGELQGMIEALKNKGDQEVLWSLITKYPQYFGEYPIIAALIDDLGDPSTMQYRLLQALAYGKTIETNGFRDRSDQKKRYALPKVDRKQLILQLKQGFDPAGKTEMISRLILICTICGAEENDWYLSLLDTAKKDMRTLVICALRNTKENIPFLLQLVKKEHGKTKEMIYRVLSQWDTPEVVAFWNKMKSTKPAAYLSSTALDIYGDMAAKHLRAALEKILDAPYITRKQMDDTIAPWISALTNKASKEVLALYQWISERKARLPEVQEVCYYGNVQNTPMLPLFGKMICETLMLRCPMPLVDFLQQTIHVWEDASFLADILTLPAAEVYEKWNERSSLAVRKWLQSTACSEKGCFVTKIASEGAVLSWNGKEILKRPLKEALDLRWLDVFMKNDWEDMLGSINFHLPEIWRQKVGAYFYQKSIRIEKDGHVSDLRMRLYNMNQLGWQNYDNILVSLCKAQPDLPEYLLREAFLQYEAYAGRENTQREARQILEFYRNTPECVISADTVSEMLRKDGFFRESEK